MSAIGSVGSSSAMAMMQRMQPSSGTSGDFASHMQAQFEAALKSAGVEESEISSILDDVSTAMEDAKANGKSRGSVREAVNAVLSDHGVDVTKFEEEMEAKRPKGPPSGGGSSFSSASVDQSLVALIEQQLTGKGTMLDLAA